MTDQFAAWVTPIALRFQSTRREITELARRVPADAWEATSPNEAWTYRDVLAHLAEGDVFLRMVIQAVLDGANTDLRPRSAERETRIASGLERGALLTVDELIDRTISDCEATQMLLARLTDAHEDTKVITSRTKPDPTGLGVFLAGYQHDEEHLAHLRPALMAEGAIR